MSMRYMNHKMCACGGAIVWLFIKGVPVEQCERADESMCPMPAIEFVPGHSPAPDRAPAFRPYVLSTSSATAATETFSGGPLKL